METNLLNKDQVKNIMRAFEDTLNKRVNAVEKSLRAEALEAVKNGDYDNYPTVLSLQKQYSEAIASIIDTVEFLKRHNVPKDQASNVFNRYGALNSGITSIANNAADIYANSATLEQVVKGYSNDITHTKTSLALADYGLNSRLPKDSVLLELQAKLSVMQPQPYETLKAQLLDSIDVESWFVATVDTEVTEVEFERVWSY